MLSVRRDQVDIEVLSEGSRGVLGFGAENARVRLLVKLPAPARPAERFPLPESVEVVPKPEKAGVHPTVAEPKARPVSPPPTTEAQSAAAEAAQAPAEQAGRDILGELLTLMGIHATVESRLDEDLADEGQPPPPVLNITGDDLGILIGRRGETVRALQYLLRLMVSHRLKHWTNLVVDVESYRVRRRRALESLANRVADEVARSGRLQALEPMPPDERRVIHVTLRNHPNVTTQSIGEGERRKVTIVPRR